MTPQNLLAESLLTSRDLLLRYLDGFDDSTRTATAPGCPNHVAWCLGHCALVANRFAEPLDRRSLPETEFIAGSNRGNARQFGTESICFASTPSPRAEDFPGLGRCRDIFSAGVDRLAAWLRSCESSRLETPVRFFPGLDIPPVAIVPRLVFHHGHHCGQIADLRRALGMKSIFA